MLNMWRSAADPHTGAQHSRIVSLMHTNNEVTQVSTNTRFVNLKIPIQKETQYHANGFWKLAYCKTACQRCPGLDYSVNGNPRPDQLWNSLWLHHAWIIAKFLLRVVATAGMLSGLWAAASGVDSSMCKGKLYILNQLGHLNRIR